MDCCGCNVAAPLSLSRVAEAVAASTRRGADAAADAANGSFAALGRAAAAVTQPLHQLTPIIAIADLGCQLRNMRCAAMEAMEHASHNRSMLPVVAAAQAGEAVADILRCECRFCKLHCRPLPPALSHG